MADVVYLRDMARRFPAEIRDEIDEMMSKITCTIAEINALHGGGAVLADYVKLHGITASAVELNALDDVTAGTVAASKAIVVDANKAAAGIRNITFNTTGDLATHPLVFEGVTLATNTNVIRGASVNPTRTSGWISFSGTVGATPAQVYTDYRELHTTGVAEILGFGAFPYMDAGASCKSMFAHQAICYVSAGSTVLTAGGLSGSGIFPVTAKCVLDGMTFNSGGVAAAIFASVQVNVTDVSAENVSVFNIENASGVIKDIFFLRATSGSWRNFFTFAAEQSPILDWGADAANCSGAPTKGIRCMVGATEYWIPMYINT